MMTLRQIAKGLFFLVLVGCILFLLVVVFFVARPSISSYLNRRDFNSQEWKSHLDDRNPIKINMVDKLLENYQLVGKTRQEVESLLGKPSATGYFKDYDFVYWLGPERSIMSIDSEWLGIKFQNDKVIKVELLKD